MGLGDFANAQAIKKIMQEVATTEINRQRPKARYAVVNSINWTERSCMVTFVGETEAVRAVFTSVAPSSVGQEVRIGGTGSDRYIEAIRGVSSDETRLNDHDTDLAFRLPSVVSLRMAADLAINSTVKRIPFNTQVFTAQGTALSSDALGYITFLEKGIYRVSTKVGYDFNSASGTNDVTIYLQWLSGSSSAVADLQIDQSGGTHPHSLTITEINAFGPGDRVCVNIHSYLTRSAIKSQSVFQAELIMRLPPDPPPST